MSDMAVGARHTKENSPGSLPRSARLSKPEDFNRVFRKPTVSRDHCFKVLARINDEDQSRLGMAVSRRIDKRAVGRNRIKRVIRESFRKAFNSQSEADRQSLDIVVLPGLETATICNRTLFRSLEKHWLRLDDRLRENK